MHNRPFEIILMATFGLIALGSLAFVALYKGGGDDAKDKPYGEQVIVWGTFPMGMFTEVLTTIRSSDKAFGAVQYIEKEPRTFQNDLVNAIADGSSPDLVILPHELLVSLRSKLLPITYETFPERTFKDTYVEGAEIFMGEEGIYGIPFGVDPLVLYWNRDLFSNAGLSNPPRTWEELVNITTPALTKRDDNYQIEKSAIALGEFGNVTNAKEILSMLFLQAGSILVERRGITYRVVLNETVGEGLPTGDAALSFYTQFSNPASGSYTWNRSLENDRTRFLGGDLALYIGFASEYEDLRKANPNLNFDVAVLPQGSASTVRRNYANFYAFAIPRATANEGGAYNAAVVMAGEDYVELLTEKIQVAPALRSLLGKGSSNPARQIAYQTSLISRGWLDPNPVESEATFKDMIQGVTSGRVRISDAIQDASEQLRLLFK